MSYGIKPSAGMLPIQDLNNIMEKQGFMKQVLASDIQEVTSKREGDIYSPGITAPELIAICANQRNENGTIDRETVKNSLNLNGVPESEFLKIVDKKSLENLINELSNNKADEIKLLRDELYSIKSELVKTGHLDDTFVADGYIDGFKQNNIKYDTKTTQITSVNGNVYTQDSNIFNVNNWAALVTTFANNSDQKDIKHSIGLVTNEVGNDITVTSDAVGVTTDNTVLKRTLGSYIKRSFSFSNIEPKSAAIKEKYTILNDDSNTLMKDIKKNFTGYAATIKIPKKCLGVSNDQDTGFLTSFSVDAKSVGNPGAVTCYVLKGDSESIESMTFVDIEMSAIAISSPATEVNEDGELYFSFLNSKNSVSTMYPEILPETYCFVLRVDNVSDTDYWQIKFGQAAKESVTAISKDLQTNNKSYYFTDKDKNSFVRIEDDMDMLYTIATKAIEIETETPYSVGLYSTSQPIKLAKPITATRARLTLEVNKEGNLICISKGLIAENNNIIKFTKNDGTEPSQKIMEVGDTVIVNNKIAKITAAESNRISIDRALYIDSVSSIYRCGYEAKIRTYEIDEVTNVILPESDCTRDMNLVAVIPSGRDISSSISDRLVFEIELYDESDILQFNRAEFQIKWKSSMTTDQIRGEKALNNSSDCTGRIYNMSLAFDNYR